VASVASVATGTENTAAALKGLKRSFDDLNAPPFEAG